MAMLEFLYLIVGGIITYLIQERFRRRPSDAVAEDVLVKTNDEIRRRLNGANPPFKMIIGDGSHYIIDRVKSIDIGYAGPMLSSLLLFRPTFSCCNQCYGWMAGSQGKS
jgi:hypothetical protein